MKLIITEKAVMKIEAENSLTFETSKIKTKDEIKKEIEEMFKVKVDKVGTQIKNNKKYAYVKLNKANPAIDIATTMGVI